MTDDIKTKWCRQLMNEFSRIAQERKFLLDCPNFQIKSGMKKVGHWSPTSRTIALSEDFILQHTWDIVLELLKHEVSHQYVTDIFKDTESKPHGPAFQKACLAVGVHPDYRGATGRYPKFMGREINQEKAPHLKKIEKLLALAESSNEHEAALAMEKANAIIAKYNIDFVLNKLEADYDYVQICVGSTKTPLTTKWILGILQKHFFVKTIIVSSYNAEKCSKVKAFEIVGSADNLAIAEYVFHFLCSSIETLWKDYQKKARAKGAEKRSFCVGVLKGFGDKLDASDQAQHEEMLRGTSCQTTSLLIVDQDTQLNKFFLERFPNVRKGRSTKSRIRQNAFASGIGEGKRLTLHKPLSSSDGNKGLFLT